MFNLKIFSNNLKSICQKFLVDKISLLDALFGIKRQFCFLRVFKDQILMRPI